MDSGLETYLLALYGLTLPSMRVRKWQDSNYAPVMGLFGTSTELIIKACHSVWNTKAKKYGKYYCRKDYHKIKQYFSNMSKFIGMAGFRYQDSCMAPALRDMGM